MPPSVGRIVHYSDELATCNAALVTGVAELEHEPADTITLMVFPASAEGEAIADVSHSATPDHIGTWHWPERTEG